MLWVSIFGSGKCVFEEKMQFCDIQNTPSKGPIFGQMVYTFSTGWGRPIECLIFRSLSGKEPYDYLLFGGK